MERRPGEALRALPRQLASTCGSRTQRERARVSAYNTREQPGCREHSAKNGWTSLPSVGQEEETLTSLERRPGERCVRSLDSLPQPTTSPSFGWMPTSVGGGRIDGSPRITLGNRNGREIPRVTNDGSDRSNMRYPRPAEIRDSRKFPRVTGKFGRDPRKLPRVTDFRGSRITRVLD